MITKQSPSENAGTSSSPACGEHANPPVLPDFSGFLAHEPGPELQEILRQAAELERLRGMLEQSAAANISLRSDRTRLVTALIDAKESMCKARAALNRAIRLRRCNRRAAAV